MDQQNPLLQRDPWKTWKALTLNDMNSLVRYQELSLFFFLFFFWGGGGGGRDIPRIVSIWRPSENPYNISSSSHPCQALQKFLYDKKKKETFLSLNLKFQAVHWVLSFFFFLGSEK